MFGSRSLGEERHGSLLLGRRFSLSSGLLEVRKLDVGNNAGWSIPSRLVQGLRVLVVPRSLTTFGFVVVLLETAGRAVVVVTKY